jgi:hypothetical protein
VLFLLHYPCQVLLQCLALARVPRAPLPAGLDPDFDSHLHPARPFILIQIVTDNARTVHYRAFIYALFYLVRYSSFPEPCIFSLGYTVIIVSVSRAFTDVSGRFLLGRVRALLGGAGHPVTVGHAWPMVTGWHDHTPATDRAGFCSARSILEPEAPPEALL